MNNETIGISAEVAIANIFSVQISDNYRKRSSIDVVTSLEDLIVKTFDDENIPIPYRHIAEGQNPIDFILENGQTLSVKTNQKGAGKVAPEIIGQPTSNTFFEFINNRFSFDVSKALKRNGLIDNYQNRSYIFKQFIFENIVEMLDTYWDHLFECDYYIHFYGIIDSNGNISNNPKCFVMKRQELPFWDIEKISFTQSISSWNESNTIKYGGISIGEFQVHRNRNCFKFRFNIEGLLKAIENHILVLDI